MGMEKVITPPVGSFNTITVFSRAVPYLCGKMLLSYYRKRDGGRITADDLSRVEYVRLITREEHAQGEKRRVETIPARHLVAV